MIFAIMAILYDTDVTSKISPIVLYFSYMPYIAVPVLIAITLFSRKFQKKYQTSLLILTLIFNAIQIISALIFDFSLGFNEGYAVGVNRNIEQMNQYGVDFSQYINFENIITSIIIVTAFTLYAELTRYAVLRRRNVEAELKLAENLQKELIPEIDQNIKNLEVYGKSMAAQDVGGDYIDFIILDSGKRAIAVADVSGHNVASGLLMSMLKTAFRTELKYEVAPNKITTSLNKTIFENKNRSMFISFLFGLIDEEGKVLELVNAGHPPLLHFSAKNKRYNEYRTGDLALGLKKDFDFKSSIISIEKEDILILFSDGILETKNREGLDFGLEKIANNVVRNCEKSAKEIYTSIFQEIIEFRSGEFKDDVTLLIVKVQ